MPPYIHPRFFIIEEEFEAATMGVTVLDNKIPAFTKQQQQRSTSFAVLQQGDVFLEMEEDVFGDPASPDGLVDVDLNQASIVETIPKPSTRKVSFAQVRIREHAVILGDHPCCTVGLPVALGWEVERESVTSLEDYESQRCRRPRNQLRLSFEDRRLMLSDVPEADVRRVSRKLHRQRRCSGRAKQRFFDAPLSLLEGTTE